MVVTTPYLSDRAPSGSTATAPSRVLAVPVVHIRPRSAAALVPADGGSGPGRVERLLRLARNVLPWSDRVLT
jgi:hypothetical protein